MNMDLDNDNTLQIIDPNLGLKLANFKTDLAESLLKMMVDELPIMRNSILKAYNSKKYDDLYKEVHKLHGASCYCGVPRMKMAASILESKLKTGTREEVDQLLEAFIFEVDQVLECYAQNYT